MGSVDTGAREPQPGTVSALSQRTAEMRARAEELLNTPHAGRLTDLDNARAVARDVVALTEELERLAGVGVSDSPDEGRIASTLRAMLRVAASEPIGVDISDYGDEWCAGFLAGQVNALEELEREAGVGVARPAEPPTEKPLDSAANTAAREETRNVDTTVESDLLYDAFAVIANVSEGDWTKQPQEWQDAAVRWRDAWHETLAEKSEAEGRSPEEVWGDTWAAGRVDELEAECGRLREQLDAARQALEQIARLDEQTEAYVHDEIALRVARAALGVVDAPEDLVSGHRPPAREETP